MNHHTHILRIARTGNPARALRLFGELGLDRREDDPKLLTLHGRLLKYHARQCSGRRRAALFADASKAYLAAFDCAPDTYPLINAAALALFAGDEAQSRALALQVLEMIEADPQEGETPYWREATRSEALLLLGRTDDAEAALADAISKGPLAHEDLAATIGQYEWIIAAQQGDAGWLEAYRPPGSLHFSGLIGLDPDAPDLCEMIADKIAQLRPGHAFGALAAGADIMIAEAALAAGAQLHIILPEPVAAFRAISVEPYGAQWPARFDALIEQAASLEIIADALDPADCPFEAKVQLASLLAMGLCLRHADILRSTPHALTITAPEEQDRPHIRHWLQSGRPLHTIETGRHSNHARGNITALKTGLAGLVLVAGGDQPAIAALAQKHHGTAAMHGGHVLFTGSPQASLAFLKECLKSDPDSRASLLFEATDRHSPQEALKNKIDLIARTSDFGRVMTDRQTALIAQVLDRECRPEEAGEIASLYGPISLWSLSVV